ncbi:MAG: hypothetical protein R2850_07360 [Bacteroidia bacterium]
MDTSNRFVFNIRSSCRSFTSSNNNVYSHFPGASGTCPASGSVTVTVNPAPTVNAGSDVSVCNGVAANLSASGATSYSWSPAAGMSAPNSANTSVTPSATSTYTVTGVSAAGCSATDNVTVTVHAYRSPIRVTVLPIALVPALS